MIGKRNMLYTYIMFIYLCNERRKTRVLIGLEECVISRV